jgi:hypothetical protein
MALTAGSIITDACQIAKCPGMTLQAGDFLNEILSTISQIYDFPEAQQLLQLSVGPNLGTGISPAQPFQWYPLVLPAGSLYLRTKSVFYNVQGTIFFLNQLLKDQYDQLFQGSGISNYPYWYVVDQTLALPTPPQMAFYPPPNISLTVNVRVQYQPPDIVTPVGSSQVPWLRNRRYLVTRLAADMMQITGDSRRAEFDASATQQMDKYLTMIDDKENVATTVKLDPLRFRQPMALAPTKTTGFLWITGFLCSTMAALLLEGLRTWTML